MSEPFREGNIAIVLLGEGLESIGSELKEYCSRLKAAYEFAYPERPCGFDLVSLEGSADAETFWNALALPHYSNILVVSYGNAMAQGMVDAIKSAARFKTIAPVVDPNSKYWFVSDRDNCSPEFFAGRCWVNGVVINPSETVFPSSEGVITCEMASALRFLKILILWNYSRSLISVDIADLRHILGSKPVCVEEFPPIGHTSCAHVMLTIKGERGICCIANFEPAWEDIDSWGGVDTDFFFALSEYTTAQAGPDDHVFFFDLWEPVAI